MSNTFRRKYKINAGTKIAKTIDKKWDTFGPGGKNCPCCTKAPPAEMKRPRRQAIRRRDKQELHISLNNE